MRFSASKSLPDASGFLSNYAVVIEESKVQRYRGPKRLATGRVS